MRQLSLILLLSVAMLCSACTPRVNRDDAMAKSCHVHGDCGTFQACNQEQCVDLCFSANCNKGVNNARDEDGWTPLHRAAWKNNAEVTKLLVENSADVDSTDKYGETALHEAAKENSVEVAKLLLKNSANVDSANKWGRTALHWAAWKNSVDVARVLIENFANVDSTDNSGLTPLHYAAWQNSVGVAKLLLAKSANLNATAVSGWTRGKTPLQVAEYEGNQEMVELLRNA